MKKIFTQAFKKQAIEKALNRQDNITLKEIAEPLGVGLSSHSRWILQAKKQELETVSPNEIMNMTKDKRPQDWTLEERFNMVLSCNTLDDEALSEYCRARGIFPVMLRNGSWILSVSIQQRIGQFH